MSDLNTKQLMERLSATLAIDLGCPPPKFVRTTFALGHKPVEAVSNPKEWREVTVSTYRGFTRWEKDAAGRVLVHLGTYDGPGIWCMQRHVHAAEAKVNNR